MGGWLSMGSFVQSEAALGRARQLLEAGVGPNAVTSKVARGRLRRLHRGVYAVGALESELTAPTAALAACGPEAFGSTTRATWR